MPIFRPLTALFGGFEVVFSYKTDKSAILCPDKTEVADFVSFKGLIVQGFNRSSIKLLYRLQYVEVFSICNHGIFSAV